MTDKEKLEKIKALADKMYSRMSYLTSDTRPIRQAMDEYHQFIINEYHKEEPVSNPIDFEQELYKAFGQVKDFTLGMRIAKWFYDMGKNSQEPISEEFEKALAEEWQGYVDRGAATVDAFEDNTQELAFAKGFYRGANWQKEQMIAKAVDATVHIDAGGYPYIPQIELYDYDKDIPFAKEGDKYKVILIKED